MQTYALVAHANSIPSTVQKVSVRWKELSDGRLMLRFRVDGVAGLVVPEPLSPVRADDLWQTTCFELFLNDGEGRYREFNFSPSRQWAAYRFDGYRSNGRDYDPWRTPEILAEKGQSVFMLTAFIGQSELKGVQSAALSAVLEEDGEIRTYWALAHGGDKPDFHDPACFRVPLVSAGKP